MNGDREQSLWSIFDKDTLEFTAYSSFVELATFWFVLKFGW